MSFAGCRVTMNVLYQQVAVHLASEAHPFPFWSEEHLKQGFAWRPTSAAFEVPKDGPHEVIVAFGATPNISPGAARAIEVPFAVSPDESVQIASVGDDVAVSVPAGRYSLRFEYLDNVNSEPIIRFTFAPSRGSDFFHVFRTASMPEISASDLLISADPAV